MCARRVSQSFVGNIAVVHVPGPGQTRPGPQQLQIIRGAQDRARQLGYQAYEFSLGGEGMRVEAVVRMLRARGVLGLIFIYTRPLEQPLEFPWKISSWSSSTTGGPSRSCTRSVTIIICRSTNALTRLRGGGLCARGDIYRALQDERTGFKWSGAFSNRFRKRLADRARAGALSGDDGRGDF